MAGRKVLVQDDGTGHMAYVDEVVVTGTSNARPIYVGDIDPAVDHVADLLPGDVWVDTTALTGSGDIPPVVTKVRNAANDGWQFVGLAASDGAGNLISRVTMGTDGSVRIDSVMGGSPNATALFDSDGSVAVLSGTSTLAIAADGAINVAKGSSSLAIGADGAVAVTASEAALTLSHGDGNLVRLGADGSVDFDGTGVFKVQSLPTADPATGDGALWLDSGVMTIST